jgi:hypothetical protein
MGRLIGALENRLSYRGQPYHLRAMPLLRRFSF